MTDPPDTAEDPAKDPAKGPAPPENPSAADSPWYVLMTVAGEQTSNRIDWDLHARNRRYWNGWQVQALSKEEKLALIGNGRASADDLYPLSTAEKDAIATALTTRCPSATPPDPADPVQLRGQKVERDLVCIGYIFSRQTLFKNTIFARRVFFDRATFFKMAEFLKTTFVENAYFEGTRFSETAVFQNATCSESVYFMNGNFSGDAIFQETNFLQDARFRRSKFSGQALFRNAAFSGHTVFRNVTFYGDAIFEDATFCQRAFFIGAQFHEPTTFVRARFSPPDARPPEFFSASLHEDTDFHGINWPLPPPDDPDRARAFRRAYERLKLLMDGQKKTHDEHMFHRMEARCREIEAPGTLATQLSRAFGLVSDYGWSLTRPAAALGMLLAAGWVLIGLAEWADYALGHWPDAAACVQDGSGGRAVPLNCPEYLGPGQSGAVSLSNVFGFLGFGRTFLREEVATLTTVSEIVSATQTILGLVLFFLFGLALRNNFRMR